jgi:hypothetical protein
MCTTKITVGKGTYPCCYAKVLVFRGSQFFSFMIFEAVVAKLDGVPPPGVLLPSVGP